MQTRIDFTPDDEQKMNSAARWGMFIAAATILGAAASLVGTALAFGGVPALPEEAPVHFRGFFWLAIVVNALVPLILGVFLWRASAAFRRVATTDDDDPAHLLRGFRSLRAYFMTQGILFVVGFGMVLVMFVSVSLLW